MKGIKASVETNAYYGQVPGDGEWHSILSNLNGVNAFEVVARIDGPKGRGKYAMTHAIALSTFGGKGSRSRITKTRAYYGWFWNRIELKWAGNTEDYSLKVRTRRHYGLADEGKISQIKFHITNLWDDGLFAEGPAAEQSGTNS
ncbi:hypothetical protein [Neolewinella persica]|uniref:hypothetical protein n=1 Tax=Neolewinella persica TaxID=70998 RepID=UPI0003770948|nr:hypothetical protein [Neolewinella persica]